MVQATSVTRSERNLSVDEANSYRQSAIGARRPEEYKMGARDRFCIVRRKNSRRPIFISIPSLAELFFSGNSCLHKIPALVDIDAKTCTYGALSRKMSFTRQEDVQGRASQAALGVLSTLDIGAESGNSNRTVPAGPEEITRRFAES